MFILVFVVAVICIVSYLKFIWVYTYIRKRKNHFRFKDRWFLSLPNVWVYIYFIFEFKFQRWLFSNVSGHITLTIKLANNRTFLLFICSWDVYQIHEPFLIEKFIFLAKGRTNIDLQGSLLLKEITHQHSLNGIYQQKSPGRFMTSMNHTASCPNNHNNKVRYKKKEF